MSPGTGTRGPERRRKGGKSAEFALATDRFLAPLICRVVRAVRVLGAGLGFPVGGTFGFTPPTSDNVIVAVECEGLASWVCPARRVRLALLCFACMR